MGLFEVRKMQVNDSYSFTSNSLVIKMKKARNVVYEVTSILESLDLVIQPRGQVTLTFMIRFYIYLSFHSFCLLRRPTFICKISISQASRVARPGVLCPLEIKGASVLLNDKCKTTTDSVSKRIHLMWPSFFLAKACKPFIRSPFNSR